MTVKELKEMLSTVPDDVNIAVWSWFSDGGRIYQINKTLMKQEKRYKEYNTGGTYFIIGGFDNCFAHRLDLHDKEFIDKIREDNKK